MDDIKKKKKNPTKTTTKKHWQTLTNLPGSGAEPESVELIWA